MATLILNDALDAIVAGANGLLAAAVEYKYLSLASDYYDIYKAQRDFYYTNFANYNGGSPIGFEAAFTDQVFDNPLLPQGQSGTLYQPQYIAQNALISNFADPASSPNFFKDWWLNHANMYGDIEMNEANFSGPLMSAWEPDEVDLQATIDDYSTYLERYEEHRKDVYDERTWEWQNQSLNSSVKQASVVQSGLATSFGFLDEASTGLSDWFSTQSNGLSTYSAYRKAEAGTTAMLAARAGNARRMATDFGSEQGGMITGLLPMNRPYTSRGQPFYYKDKVEGSVGESDAQ